MAGPLLAFQMPNRTLVTFGTDGFRDYVTLPDGRTFNLGSLSVLNFVVGLARGQREARKALDTFLASQQATLAVRMEDLQALLSPKRARWAGLEETLIPSDSRMSPGRGALMDLETKALFQSRLAAAEDVLHHLEHGEVKASEEAPRLLSTIRELLAMVEPSAEPVTIEEPRMPQVVSVGGVPVTAASYDEDMLRELEVFLDNEMSLQAQRRNILKKLLKDGKYDLKEAEKAFEDWVEAGAKSYAREFNEDPKKFSKELVKDLAEKFAKSHKKAVDGGEYDHLKSASEEQAPAPQQEKEAAEHTVLINEGIAHAVLAKVQRAHEAVHASGSRFASVANGDLATISSSLVEILDGSDLSEPSVRSALLDLSKRADHVLNYFAR